MSRTTRQRHLFPLIFFALATTGWAASSGSPTTATIPAFPGAEGFGADTPGGRGGRVIYVTNLDPVGPGSFQEACDASGPRIVLFKVSGTIPSTIHIEEPYIAVAGQSAPGDGICVHAMRVSAYDVVLRNLRVRSMEDDGFEGQNCEDLILDHISASWGTDETLTFRHGDNVTVQWCLIAEGQRPHAMGSLMDPDHVSVHHNIYAHFDNRMPRFGAWVLDLRNNTIYDYGKEPVYTAYDDESGVNAVANYFKEGPSTPRLPLPTGYRPGRPILIPGPSLRMYLADNYYAGRRDRTKDNWLMVSAYVATFNGITEPWATPEEIRAKCERDRPWEAPFVATQSARKAHKLVLAHAGAFPRDSFDRRIVREVREGTGAIPEPPHRQELRQGTIRYPKLVSAPAPDDTDADGMPDEWETRFGLKPNDASDGPADLDGDGYTNVEEYLNRTNPTRFVDYKDPKNNRPSLH